MFEIFMLDHCHHVLSLLSPFHKNMKILVPNLSFWIAFHLLKDLKIVITVESSDLDENQNGQ